MRVLDAFYVRAVREVVGEVSADAFFGEPVM
jgi:hypothetical protein